MDDWPADLLTDDLADLLTRSSGAVNNALVRLIEIQSELQLLVNVAPTRPFTDEEFTRYGELTREERMAHRRYMAARDWYDGVRRRIRRRAARLERRADG